MKKPVTVNKKRWAMYAAAGAAAVITGAEAAEAQDVTHVVVGEGAGGSVGILNELTFELGDTGDFLALTNSAGYYAADPNVQTAGILDANGDDTGGIAAAILPSQFGPFNAVYGANLASGVALSELPSAGVNQTGFQSQVGVPLIYGTPSANTSFSAGGDNFIGFVFDGGNEFGWARVTFDNCRWSDRICRSSRWRWNSSNSGADFAGLVSPRCNWGVGESS